MPNGDIDKYAQEMWEARRDRTWDKAWEYGFGFIKSAGVDPATPRLQLTEMDVARLASAVVRREAEEFAQARVKYPARREQFFEQWGVPEAERKSWREYPVEPWGERASYSPSEKYISLGGGGEQTLAHELAHASYYEQMPKAMRAVYPLAHKVAQVVEPKYKEAVGKYPGGKGYEAIEGYATAYEHLGKEPERMPWYMEPFYGNLMYEVPDLPGDWEKNWAVWLGYWIKNKLQKATPETQNKWRDWLVRAK